MGNNCCAEKREKKEDKTIKEGVKSTRKEVQKDEKEQIEINMFKKELMMTDTDDQSPTSKKDKSRNSSPLKTDAISPKKKKPMEPFFNTFTVASDVETQMFLHFMHLQLMSMKTQFAIKYLKQNPEFKIVIIQMEKDRFKEWVTQDARPVDWELASKKSWAKQLGTDKMRLIDGLGTSLSDFIFDVHQATNRLFLPTQVVKSPFDVPQSLLCVFREYPFSKYNIEVSPAEIKGS